MTVTLKQLRYFDALVRHRHFGRAAQACSVSQPALSMQIQDLESRLGAILVERGRAGVTLTGDGREVARRVQQILSEVHDLVDYARHHRRLLAGPLHLGVIPSVAPYLLPPLLPRLREQFADLELHLRETQTAVLLDELVENKLDAVLLALPVDQPELETVELFEDRFVLAVPPDYRFRGRVEPPAELLRRERLLLLEEGHCFRDQALSFCRLQQVEAVNTFGASSLSTIVRMVANGHGITLLPEICLDREVRDNEVGLMRFADPEPRRMLGLAWRATSPRKHDFQELARLITALQPAR